MQIDITTNYVQGFPFLHILASTYYILKIKQYFIVLLLCISLIINDNEGFFSMQVSFTWFFLELLVFLLLSYFGSLYIIRYIGCKYFLPLHRLSLHSVDYFLYYAEPLAWFNPICLFFLVLSVLWEPDQ
jgi:hypothetical protein